MIDESVNSHTPRRSNSAALRRELTWMFACANFLSFGYTLIYLYMKLHPEWRFFVTPEQFAGALIYVLLVGGVVSAWGAWRASGSAVSDDPRHIFFVFALLFGMEAIFYFGILLNVLLRGVLR